MRIYDRAGGKPLKIDAERLTGCAQWYQEERLRAGSARDAIERGWMQDLKQYAGIPPTEKRDIPIQDSPNIEITLGAIAVDGIFSNWIELVTQAQQFVTVLPRKKFEEYADAVQDWIDWGCREAFNLEDAINTAPFECIQLGSMALYIPYVEKVKITDTYKVIDRGPRIVPIALEDFMLPEGSRGRIQEDRWVSMDMWLSSSDLEIYQQKSDWDIEGFEAAPNISQVRQRRLDVAREQSSEGAKGQLYQVAYVCGEYDIDGDGVNEELEIIIDVTSNSIARISYPKYDLRPFEFAVYQIRPHVAWGLGVQGMCAPFEEETSLIHNERTLNMRLANSRVWRASHAVAAVLEKMWTGKVIRASQGEFEGIKMADVYPASTQGELMTVSYAERCTGISDLQAQSSRLGTRTPGVSAMSYMQAANRRFTPAYRNIRGCIAAAVRQCLYRTQERSGAKDKAAIEDVMSVLGDEKGKKFVELMQKVDNLIDAVDIQVTASSISINREADRQNLVTLMQVWKDWQQARIQLEQFAATAPTMEMKQLAQAIEEASIALLRRYMRTFEMLGDVDKYLAEVRGVEQMAGQLPPEIQRGLMGMTNQLKQAAQSAGPDGAPDAQANPPPPPPNGTVMQ